MFYYLFVFIIVFPPPQLKCWLLHAVQLFCTSLQMDSSTHAVRRDYYKASSLDTIHLSVSSVLYLFSCCWNWEITGGKWSGVGFLTDHTLENARTLHMASVLVFPYCFYWKLTVCETIEWSAVRCLGWLNPTTEKRDFRSR